MTTGGLAEEQTHEAQEHLIEPKLIASNDMSYYGSIGRQVCHIINTV